MINQLNDIFSKEGLGNGCTSSAVITMQLFDARDKDKLNNFIVDFKPIEGWLCFTDKVVIFPDECTLPAAGIILSSELVSGLRSLHIRQAESGWSCHIIERQDHVGDQLVFEKSFLSIPRAKCKLRYEVFWKISDNPKEHQTFQPYISRFAGFEKTTAKTQEVKS